MLSVRQKNIGFLLSQQYHCHEKYLIGSAMSREDNLNLLEVEREEAAATSIQERLNGEIISQPPYAILSNDLIPIKFPVGLSGSLTRLTDSTSYLHAGNDINIFSSSNGSIIISANNPSVQIGGNDGEIQFNDGGTQLNGDINFTFNETTKTLSVPNLSASLTRLSNNEPYLQSTDLISLSTGSGAITITRALTDDISTSTWKSYVPSISSSPISPILPADTVIYGKYIYSSGIMKLIFSLSSRFSTGAEAGSGIYLINMPGGFEVDTSIAPIGSTSNPWDGISLGTAGLTLDVIGGGGAWSVVPASSTRLMLYGKSISDSVVSSWGSGKFPMGIGNDLRVSFVATIPAKISTTTSEDWNGPNISLDGGMFTVTGPIYEDWAGPDITLSNGTWTSEMSQYMTLGTVYVEGLLTFNASTSINLYNTVFYYPGTYVLFDYSAPGASFPGGQSQLDSNVIVTCVDLPSTILTSPTLTNDSVNKKILLTLSSNPTNGKVFVEGNLTFTGATNMILSKKLYATAGTYELFEFSGTYSGVTEYLTCVSLAGFTCGTPYVEGNLVKVTLT